MRNRITATDHHADFALVVRTSIRHYLEVFTAHRGLWRCLLEGMLQNPTIEPSAVCCDGLVPAGVSVIFSACGCRHSFVRSSRAG